MVKTRNITVIDLTGSIADEIIDRLEKLVSVTFEGERRTFGEVNIVLTDDEELHRLNLQWRHIDETTDVLSFNLQDEQSEIVDGDVYVSIDRAIEQASDAGLESELSHLVAHGIMHLCGWEHETETKLEKMLKTSQGYIDIVLQGVKVVD